MNIATYPRKWLLIVAIVLGVIILISTLVGVHYTSKQNSKIIATPQASINRMATAADMNWYKKVPEKPVTKPKTVTVTTPGAVAINSASAIPLLPPTTADANTKAMRAYITSNELKPSTTTATPPSNTPTATGDQNDQFVQLHSQSTDYLGTSVQTPISHYELQAGTIIPGVLVTGIDSDLPGQIIGQVRENVYDSITGNHLLVPQGSKLIGVYDAKVAYGQKRVLIAWQRIIFPNGNSIDLDGMQGTDLSGYAGFHDQVDNHYMRIFGSVLLMSMLSAGAQLSQPQNNSGLLVGSAPSVGQTIAGSVGANIANTATMLTRKNINIQPTLDIRPGYEFNVTVTKDMVFPEG